MEFFDFVNISERFQKLINPVSAEKISTVGRYLRLSQHSKLIDFGSGFAEPLVIWANDSGCRGVGIDIRPYACERANERIREVGLQGQLEIVCGKGSEYCFEDGAFDAATCIGATFVFGGFRETLRVWKRAVTQNGRIAVGEVSWSVPDVPQELRDKHPDYQDEIELLYIIHEEGFELEYLVRACRDD